MGDPDQDAVTRGQLVSPSLIAVDTVNMSRVLHLITVNNRQNRGKTNE